VDTRVKLAAVLKTAALFERVSSEEEAVTHVVMPYLEDAKFAILHLGGVDIRAHDLSTVVEALERMSQLTRAGDARFVGLGMRLFTMLLTGFRGNAECFSPAPPEAQVTSFHVREIEPKWRTVADTREWELVWLCRYLDPELGVLEFPIAYTVRHFPRFNLPFVSPSLRWVLALAKSTQPQQPLEPQLKQPKLPPVVRRSRKRSSEEEAGEEG